MLVHLVVLGHEFLDAVPLVVDDVAALADPLVAERARRRAARLTRMRAEARYRDRHLRAQPRQVQQPEVSVSVVNRQKISTTSNDTDVNVT